MNNRGMKKGGYAGLVALVVSAAVIGFVVWRLVIPLAGGEGQSVLERDLGAIDAAKNAKNLIESRNNL